MGKSASNDVVPRLDVLYRQGKELSDQLGKTFEAVDTAYLMLGPWDQRPERKPDFDYDQFEKDVTAKTSEWTKQVLDILSNEVAQVRFRLQFDDPKRVYISIDRRDDKQLDRIKEVLDLFGDRVSALYEIIPKLEESMEWAQQEPSENVGPPEYDAKTRTLYFAGEAIRFKKNAEFTPAICDLMINKHPDTKLWRLEEFQELWDPQYEYLGKRPNDWQRVHNAIQKLNLRIAKKTKISDLFELSTGAVRINPKYTKK